MAEWREVVLRNPELGRGAWRQQVAYYDNRQPVYDGRDVIAPGTLQENEEAVKWRNELCKGNQDAVAICALAFQYFHAIDDLIDSIEDGRPVMSKDQILSLFMHAAAFYNCRFYREHQELLFPVMLHITGTYADSVAWEKSPRPHLRAIADILRMTGDDFYKMVALICGGPDHRSYVSRGIMERDWWIQHDAQGRPI